MATISTITPAERHYDPTNDLLFKFVFGSEKRKHITLQFINDVIGLDGDKAFVDLHFKNSELPPEKQGDKLGRLDVFVVTNDGQRVDI
ncbi:MAG: PD-(D/E)XK nuclease family transposase [Anaerovibrio sp.]|nr:PD-(D/E)XK nuclease family transposase [Anaerovibrio sp.]